MGEADLPQQKEIANIPYGEEIPIGPIVQEIEPTNEQLLEIVTKIDDFLLDNKTPVAKLLNKICPLKGPDYLTSCQKRVFVDLPVAIPVAVILTPVAVLALLAKFVEDGKNPLFIQQRYKGENEPPQKIYKIRTMVKNAEQQAEIIEQRVNQKNDALDTRITPFGQFLRDHKIDEFLQIFQILIGQMELVGIRATPLDIVEHLKNLWKTDRFNRWNIFAKVSFAATGLKQVLYGKKYAEKSRFYADVWYAKNASLGLDYYILWRTFIKIFFPDLKL